MFDLKPFQSSSNSHASGLGILWSHHFMLRAAAPVNGYHCGSHVSGCKGMEGRSIACAEWRPEMMHLEAGRGWGRNAYIALGLTILSYYQPPPESWLFPPPGPLVLGHVACLPPALSPSVFVRCWAYTEVRPCFCLWQRRKWNPVMFTHTGFSCGWRSLTETLEIVF